MDRTPCALLLVGAVACGLVLALVGCSGASGTATATATGAARRSTYTLMQMNLCLSGVAGCYREVHYPAGLQQAIARIREARPDAITLNEACSRDAALIGRRTGYHVRFAPVRYYGEPLRCVRPGGRGQFGDAVLTKASVRSADSHAFDAQAGPERRVWLCADTRVGVDVCTAHLASSESDEAAANEPQCIELRILLARRAATRTVIFGGDLNRRSPCAPNGFWTTSDHSAGQDPGSQHVYGSGALSAPSARVVPVRFTDHDVLLVHADLALKR